MFSLDKSKNDTSIWLDVLRALAAQMVCVGHALSFYGHFPPPFGLSYPQNVGVLIFFLLSGFLIARTLLERSEDIAYDFWTYAIDRFARIYSGLIPALIFIAIVDWIVFQATGTIGPYSNLKHLIGNLFMLEAYRGVLSNIFSFSAFGSGAPLWTLAIEWNIYMFVGAVFFLGLKRNSVSLLVLVAVIAGQTACHFLFGGYQTDGVGNGLFGLWLLGAASFLILRTQQMSTPLSLAVLLISAALYLALVKGPAEYTLKSYLLLSVVFISFVSLTQRTRLISDHLGKRAVRLINFFADYSFTLYLTHHTVLVAAKTIWPNGATGAMLSAIIVANFLAALIAIPTEMHHRQWAKWIRRRFLPEEQLVLAAAQVPDETADMRQTKAV